MVLRRRLFRGCLMVQLTVAQNFYQLNWYNISIPMLQAHPLLKISTQDLHLPTLGHSDHCTKLGQELIRTIKTPRCSIFQKEQQEVYLTQKLQLSHKPNSLRERLPSLRRLPTDLKENLLDLDLYFEMEPLCQNGQYSSRQPFVIRKINTPSASSKGKQTTTGSHDSSLEMQKDSSSIKNATPSIERKNAPTGRGRSESKHIMTCRIVNSKKLPFDVRPKNRKPAKQQMEEFAVDVSAILKKESFQPLMSSDSLESLYRYL